MADDQDTKPPISSPILKDEGSQEESSKPIAVEAAAGNDNDPEMPEDAEKEQAEDGNLDGNPIADTSRQVAGVPERAEDQTDTELDNDGPEDAEPGHVAEEDPVIEEEDPGAEQDRVTDKDGVAVEDDDLEKEQIIDEETANQTGNVIASTAVIAGAAKRGSEGDQSSDSRADTTDANRVPTGEEDAKPAAPKSDTPEVDTARRDKATKTAVKPTKTKTLALNTNGAPMAFALSLAGALPFIFGALAQYIPLVPTAYAYLTLPAVLWYGAVILSFLGGIRWGLALRVVNTAQRTQLMALSVVPSLLGWFALFMPPEYAVTALIFGFAGQGAWDVWTAERSGAPPWFTTLRLTLTLIVVTCLVLIILAISEPLTFDAARSALDGLRAPTGQ